MFSVGGKINFHLLFNVHGVREANRKKALEMN
jgi:hypothetical protein